VDDWCRTGSCGASGSLTGGMEFAFQIGHVSPDVVSKPR